MGRLVGFGLLGVFQTLKLLILRDGKTVRMGINGSCWYVIGTRIRAMLHYCRRNRQERNLRFLSIPPNAVPFTDRCFYSALANRKRRRCRRTRRCSGSRSAFRASWPAKVCAAIPPRTIIATSANATVAGSSGRARDETRLCLLRSVALALSCGRVAKANRPFPGINEMTRRCACPRESNVGRGDLKIDEMDATRGI